MGKFPRLETDSLILRETKPADAASLLQIFSDPAVTRYHDVETATKLEQAKQLVDWRARRFRSGQGIRWGIARKVDDRLIGSCGYSYRTSFRAELGYELAQAFWRQGVMTEALKAVIQFGFQHLELNRVEAMVMLENTASIKLLEKLGFAEEGILRQYGFWKGQFHDLRLFSLLKQDSIAPCD